MNPSKEDTDAKSHKKHVHKAKQTENVMQAYKITKAH